VVHDAGPNPTADPIGYGVANHGPGDGPANNRAAIELALLDRKARKDHDEGRGKEQPNEDKGFAESEAAEYRARQVLMMQHISLYGMRIERSNSF
jgi:hypothetical protein